MSDIQKLSNIFVNVNGVLLDWKTGIGDFRDKQGLSRAGYSWDVCQEFHDSPDHKFLTPIPGAIAAMGSILKLSPEITVHIISNSNDTPIQLNSRLYNLMDYFPKTILKSAWFLQAGRRKLDFAKSILPNSIDIFTSLLIDDQEYQLNMWEKGGGLALRFENWDSAEIILRDSYGLVV